MQTFLSYIKESSDSMVGTVGSDKKGLRHIKNYVMPFLSASGRKKTAKAFEGHMNFGDTSSNGEHHDPNAEYTHELATKQGTHPAGTKVKVTHVTMGANNSLIAHTEKHGSMPLSALKKPASVKKPAITKGGFDVESKIAENLGTKAAGSTKHGYDFKYGENVRGKVKTVDKKTGGAAPVIRGESKLDKGKMGQSTFKHTKEKGWHFTNEAVGKHFEKATIVGDDGKERSLIDHFNHYHGNGVIDRAYSIPAPKGSTRNYLSSSNVNALHLHDKKSNKGTTYTIGDRNELKGKTKLGHLSNKDLDSLDGTLSIEKTTTGSTQVAHRPRATRMRELALNSVNDPSNHRDLTNPDHAVEFKKHVDKIK
jgi:hypothetical protein